MKPRVAIACQGGGSQTAFTAGVLKALFENKIQDRVNIVSLSGTSGGAICAFLIWYALRKGDDCVWKRLLDFWEDNCAQTHQGEVRNFFGQFEQIGVNGVRLFEDFESLVLANKSADMLQRDIELRRGRFHD